MDFPIAIAASRRWTAPCSPGPICPLKPAELGCFLSHYEVIRQADRASHLHVVEDDVRFGARTAPVLDQIIGGALEQCDLLYTDISINFNLILFLSALATMRSVGADRLGPEGWPASVGFMILQRDFWSTASYLVSRDALDRLTALLEQEIALGPRMAIDSFYAALTSAGRIKARCTVPFLTSIVPPHAAPTTVQGGETSFMDTVSYLMRCHFFIDRDEAEIRAMAASLNAGAALPAYAEPMLDTFRFMLSGGRLG